MTDETRAEGTAEVAADQTGTESQGGRTPAEANGLDLVVGEPAAGGSGLQPRC